MSKIKPTKWSLQVKIFEKYGAKYIREKGDHLIYHYPSALRPVVIPKYKEVPVSIILNNMKVVGMNREAYFEILNKVK